MCSVQSVPEADFIVVGAGQPPLKGNLSHFGTGEVPSSLQTAAPRAFPPVQAA